MQYQKEMEAIPLYMTHKTTHNAQTKHNYVKGQFYLFLIYIEFLFGKLSPSFVDHCINYFSKAKPFNRIFFSPESDILECLAGPSSLLSLVFLEGEREEG
jgi:hypothetical protein